MSDDAETHIPKTQIVGNGVASVSCEEGHETKRK